MSFLVLGMSLWLLSAFFLIFVWLAYFLGEWVVAIVPVTQLSVELVNSMLVKANFMERLTGLTILVVFSWTIVELAFRALHVQREHLALATFKSLISKSEFDEYKEIPFKLSDPRAIRRVNLIMECSSQDLAKLHDAIPPAASLDSSIMAESYGPLNVYAWVLPVLGFIGTATGMAEAIGGFKGALGKTRDFDTLVETLSQQVIPGLAGAFQITILALGASLVAYLCTSALRGWDQDALNSLDQLCVIMLSRIPLPVGPEFKEATGLLRAISEQLEGLLKVPINLDKAAEAIGGAAGALASASNDLKESASAEYVVRKMRPGESK